MRLPVKVLFFVFLLLLFVACKQETDLEEPPVILYGEDICEECSMIITEPRFAASYVTEAGEVHRFDDIGGMLLHDYKMHEDVYVYWVHDYNSEEWIKARESVLVLNPDLNTPMGWGLAAFAEHTDAEAYVSLHGGRMATFAEIQELVRSGELDPSILSSVDNQQEMDAEMQETGPQDDG